MTKPSVTKSMTIRRGSTKPEATKPGVESEILQESQAQQKAAATVSSREESRVLQELQARYPEVRWVVGKRFSFRPPRTIQLGEPQSHYVQLVLHELGHCLAGHRDFRTDIGRLQLEREAWERAHAVWQELHLKEQGIESGTLILWRQSSTPIATGYTLNQGVRAAVPPGFRRLTEFTTVLFALNLVAARPEMMSSWAVCACPLVFSGRKARNDVKLVAWVTLWSGSAQKTTYNLALCTQNFKDF